MSIAMQRTVASLSPPSWCGHLANITDRKVLNDGGNAPRYGASGTTMPRLYRHPRRKYQRQHRARPVECWVRRPGIGVFGWLDTTSSPYTWGAHGHRGGTHHDQIPKSIHRIVRVDHQGVRDARGSRQPRRAKRVRGFSRARSSPIVVRTSAAASEGAIDPTRGKPKRET